MTGDATEVKVLDRAPLGASHWKLWTSSGLSNLADGVFKIALPLLAVQLTQSPTLVAGLAVAATLPWLLFALTAGALADRLARLNRRKLMLWANVSRAILPLLLVAVILLDFAPFGLCTSSPCWRVRLKRSRTPLRSRFCPRWCKGISFPAQTVGSTPSNSP
jgi:MFS family permease